MTQKPPIVLEAVLACGIAALFTLWSGTTQQPTSSVTWDAVQYYQMTSQIAAGQTPAAEAPYVYRLGLPWLVARIWPSDPARGFFVINVLCGVFTAPLLALWLRTGVERLSVRLAVVALFSAAWHGPIRYVHFNGGYVDPPFLVCVLLALAVLHAMRADRKTWQIAAFAALTVVGTLIRETMLLLPISALLIRNPLSIRLTAYAEASALEKPDTTGYWSRVPVVSGFRRIDSWHLLGPIAAGIAVIALTHSIVVADTSRSFVAAAMQWIRKPPSAYFLAWFTAYGPVLALLVFDWKSVVRDLREQRHLLSFLGLCTMLAFFGGSDTERFVFWAMPVVYLLVGRAFERHLPVFKGAAIGAGLVVAQAISARVFWPIPDPRVETNPLTASASWLDRVYAVADRLIVIDHFHWNLWSSFGSGPFRLARLALYVAVTAALVFEMRRRSQESEPQ